MYCFHNHELNQNHLHRNSCRMAGHYHNPTYHNRAGQNLYLMGRTPEHHRSVSGIPHHCLVMQFHHSHDVTYHLSGTLDGLKYYKTSLNLNYKLKLSTKLIIEWSKTNISITAISAKEIIITFRWISRLW